MNRHEQFMAKIALHPLVTCRHCGLGKPSAEMAVISRRNVECNSCRTHGVKTCTACNEVKPAKEFYQSHRTGKCTTCERARHAARKQETSPEQWMFDRVRYRATAEGIKFTISLEDVIIPKRCPILGIKLARVGAKTQTGANPTLDRINSAKGYVPGNVAVISRNANALKGNGTAEQHERIAEWMRAQGVK